MINKKKKEISRESSSMKIVRINLLILFIILLIPFAKSAADFSVNTFSCTPSEIAINDVFSCTAQIKNNGDAAGSVSTATLYPDAGNWLEESSYAQASGSSVDPGQTTEVTFTNLRSVLSGNNGFSKIMLDDVTDTYVADNNVKENVIDVVVSVNSSVTSADASDDFDATAEVTAGGNIDVELTFTVNSGGCSIGSQQNPKTISDMSDGNIQSKSWSVTMGTTGSCSYKVTASATGDAGVASKDDSDSGTVSCNDCSSSSNTSSSSSGGGGGGGIGTTVKSIGELPASYTIELSANENLAFNYSGERHYVSVTDIKETSATIVIESEQQTFVLSIGQIINADLNGDNYAEVSVELRSINIITKKAKVVITRLTEGIIADKGEEDKKLEGGITGRAVDGSDKEISEKEKSETLEAKKGFYKILLIIVGIVIILIVIIFILKKFSKRNIYK
ncbi:hypothetical protein J4221_00965 [Candidatus Pacearchaeota archaeon]|nr:hypothetical protein [Candidatus Pacearchaeota archaeon]